MQINIFEKINTKAAFVIKECIKTAEKIGVNIYLVGGTVRDMLLCREIKDIDITVEGSVKDFARALSENTNILSVKYSENLPTAKIVFSNLAEVDIASTRKEIYEKQGNLPIITEIGCNLKDDVTRRDFTVNAVAISLNKKNLFEIIDYLGGVEDLKNRELKILYKKSFYDDPSRIIRAAKFAERLNFKLEKETMDFQNQYLDNPLRNIPLFRVKSELFELFSLESDNVFNNFIQNKIYKIFIDNLEQTVDGNLLKECAKKYLLPQEDLYLLYFSALFINEFPSEKLNLSVRELKIIQDIQTLLSDRKNEFEDKYSIYKFFKGKENISIILYESIKKAGLADIYFLIKDIKPLITGKHLIQLGISQGKIFSEILEEITKEKINNNLNGFDAELEFAKKYVKTDKGNKNG